MSPEPSTVVWKRSWRDEHLERICGLANGRGGVLEIGRDDRGEVVGVTGVLGLLEEIPKKARSMLGIVVAVNLKSEAGREYIEIAVEPQRNPISYRGRFHYRSGSAKRVLDGAALNRLMLARFGQGWDDMPGRGVGLKDLDGRAVDRFRRRAVRCERLPAEVLDESVEGLVENLDLREGAHLKRAATLLFHPCPHRLVRGAYVTIGCFQDSRLLFGDVVEGDLFTQVDRTMDLLYTKYTRGLISYDDIYRVETFPVPRVAMWEAVINAVIHRDYDSDAPIRIRVRDDRISIWNPARLAPEWSPDGLAGEHSSRLHNPRLAYAFFQAGMIETWGRGVRQMVDTCRKVGNPTPTWTLDAGGDGLRVTFPFSEAYMAADAAARGIAARGTRNHQKTARKMSEGDGDSQNLPDRIVAFLRRNPSASRRAIAEALSGATEGSVRYQLGKLKSVNRLRRVGPDKGGRWMVIDGDGAANEMEPKARGEDRRQAGDAQPPASGRNRQKPVVTTRKLPERSGDSQNLPERILAVLRANPAASRRVLATTLDTTESTVRYRLDKLRSEGRIRRIGPDKGGRWEVVETA